MLKQLLYLLPHIIFISTHLVHNFAWAFTIHPSRTTSVNLVSSLLKQQQQPIILRPPSKLKESLKVTEHNLYRVAHCISDSVESMEKLANRLHSCGVKNFYFENDNDSSDQLAPVIKGGQVNLQRVDDGEIRKDDIIHVKTLIWKGIFLRNSSNNTDGITNVEGSGSQISFYFVTALRAEDKVDLGKLRKIIKGEIRKRGGQTLILQLADLRQAEIMAGFTSGSMPPGWHSVPLKLYIDDYILESYYKKEVVEENGTNSEGQINGNYDHVGDNGDHYSKIMLSVGSGSSDYSLHVSFLDTLMSSVYSEDRTKVLEDAGLGPEWVSNPGRFIVSFTRTRAEEKNKEKQKSLSSSQMRSVTPLRDICHIDKEKDYSDGLKEPVNVTRKLLHVTARKKGKVHEVKQLVKLLGDDFPSYMRVDTGGENEKFAAEYNKNAIHYAAWKGDLETVTLLLNECKRFEDELVDAVNMISTGEGCFGKTPIFYAITQCRDDMVLHLLALGASLLIVNNKGQSPCSLAVNKLKPETCELMYQTEAAQLRVGGEFADYRYSHSDGRRYGDLDPRFLDQGDINMDDDIQGELDEFALYSTLECEEKKAMSDRNPFLLHFITEQSLPRSVRVTNPALRQAIRVKDQEDKRRKGLGKDIQPTGLSMLRSVRVTTPIWRQPSWIKEQEEKERNEVASSAGGGDAVKKEKRKTRNKNTIPSHIIKLEDGTEINIDSLDVLKLGDILQTQSNGKQKTYELIEDAAGILALEFAVEEALTLLECIEAADMNDEQIVRSSWGLDSEWRPSIMPGEVNPVATLQMSSSSRSFVIDMQSLCQNGVTDPGTQMTDAEKLLSETLTKIFKSQKIRIIGFGIAQDLSKLASSFPHLPCFYNFQSVVDLQSLSRFAYPSLPKHFMSSLQKASGMILRKRMDKTEQCSEWNLRPLRNSQLEYASLDATILPVLLDKMLKGNPHTEKEAKFFLRKHTSLQSSFRFTFLGDDTNCVYSIEMGSIKTTMDVKVARQMWPTFAKRGAPVLPQKLSAHEIQALVPNGNEESNTRVSKKEQARLKKENSLAAKAKKTPIELTQLAADIDNLSLVGKETGYTKDSCIDEVLTKEVVDSLPKNSYLRYNRRGGIIEIANCWLLFVNFTIGRYHDKYKNEFHDGGKLVSFTINPSRFKDGELLQNLLLPESMSRKSVVLFIKGSNKEKFICCGQVKCHSHKQNEENDLVSLVLEVIQFNELISTTDAAPSNYMRIVSENLE